MVLRRVDVNPWIFVGVVSVGPWNWFPALVGPLPVICWSRGRPRRRSPMGLPPRSVFTRGLIPRGLGVLRGSWHILGRGWGAFVSIGAPGVWQSTVFCSYVAIVIVFTPVMCGTVSRLNFGEGGVAIWGWVIMPMFRFVARATFIFTCLQETERKKNHRYNIYSAKSSQTGRIIIRVHQPRLIWFVSKRYKITIIDLDKIFLIIQNLSQQISSKVQ